MFLLSIFQAVFLPSIIMLAIALFCAVLLIVLSQVCSVEKSALLQEVQDLLAGTNCGGCGYAGCEAFAAALIAGKAKVTDCNPTSKTNKEQIALILGGDGDVGADSVAVVNCNGGSYCKDKFEYQGYGDCLSAELLAGGTKMCPVGCMGLGACTKACPHFAITLKNDGYAYVDRQSCTSCGICIKTCPKKIITRIPRSAPVYIACSNTVRGKEVSSVCSRGCIACGLCAKACPVSAITMVNNLPVIDYNLCYGCLKCVQVCPTKCMKKH